MGDWEDARGIEVVLIRQVSHGRFDIEIYRQWWRQVVELEEVELIGKGHECLGLVGYIGWLFLLTKFLDDSLLVILAEGVFAGKNLHALEAFRVN